MKSYRIKKVKMLLATGVILSALTGCSGKVFTPEELRPDCTKLAYDMNLLILNEVPISHIKDQVSIDIKGIDENMIEMKIRHTPSNIQIANVYCAYNDNSEMVFASTKMGSVHKFRDTGKTY